MQRNVIVLLMNHVNVKFSSKLIFEITELPVGTPISRSRLLTILGKLCLECLIQSEATIYV